MRIADVQGGRTVHSFCWLASAPLPPQFDLRSCGWRLGGPSCAGSDVERVYLAPFDHFPHPDGPASPAVQALPHRRQIMLLGVAPADARAHLLRIGFGDVMGRAGSLGEIAARAERIARGSRLLPRYRDVAGLRLDLFARDGFVRERPLGLHPREFELVWRLADTPGEPVDKASMMAQVWRVGHATGTNSLAVHVFRLRAKLRVAGLGDVIHTMPDGSYMLEPARQPGDDAALPVDGRPTAMATS